MVMTDGNWLLEAAAPLPKNIGQVVALVQAHDCYCVCGFLQDHYRLAVWRKDDTDAIILNAKFSQPPLLQIAKVPQEHSLWFVYAVDNHPKHQGQPQLFAWEIDSRSFPPQGDPPRAILRMDAKRQMNVWPDHLLPTKQQDPAITSLAVLQPSDIPKPVLLFGTACGIPLWSTQISIPMDFHIQKIEAAAKPQSLLSRGLSMVQYQPPTTQIVSIIPLIGQRGFCSVDITGKISFYEIERLDQIRFEADCYVMNLLREYFANTPNFLYDMQVEDAIALDTKVYLICNVQHSDATESSRYWVVVEHDALQGVIPLVDAVSANVMGSNGQPYALLVRPDGTQLLATVCEGEMIAESLVPSHSGVMCPDHTTHGVLLLPHNAPSLLRARYLPRSTRNDTDAVIASTQQIDTLQSLFDTWYRADANTAVSAHPSLHAAVLPLARTVYETFRNPMERHLAYIRFLQDTGLYKFLSEMTKWSLLAIGQNLQVSQTVAAVARQSVPPDAIGDFLVSLQRSNSSQWLDCLHTTLKAARDHRHTYGPPSNEISYDIVDADEALAGLLWTSSILVSVLEPQLTAWEALPDGVQNVAEPQTLLDILQWMLEAFRDHGEATMYAAASRRVFHIIRRTFRKQQDKWLFRMCCDHRYYTGLLTIHSEYTSRAPFSLTSIEKSMTADIETNMPFKQYALKWLAGMSCSRLDDRLSHHHIVIDFRT